MDSPETPKKSPQSLLMRCFFLIILCVFMVLSSSVTVVLVAALIGNFSITHPISVPSQCKIVSSTVDIRSSKVCELGLLNYKAKHVFYPSEKKKFRCRYDYYWASVFKVEYIDHSGQAQLASAEAPNEALPPDCRPSFSAAWLTKDEFKVNGTYDCWYTLGLSKVNLNHDGFFNCQASDPSTIEMLRRYSVLCSRMFFAWFASWGKASYWRWDVVAGLVTGFSTSLISISLIRILHVMSIIPRIFSAIMLSFNTARMKRACFLVAYFSLVGWLAIQYGKRLGIAI